MERLSECSVLCSLSGIKMPCKEFCSNVPSYREGGCLIAHTLLALKEYELIKDKVLNIISRLVRKTLSTSYIYASIIRQFSNTYLKEYLDLLLRYAIIMHDLGKLSRYYVNGSVRSYRHEIVSWLYMLITKDVYVKVLISDLRFPNINTELFERLLSKLYDHASLAVLLHHESFLWKEAEEERLDIIQEAQGLLARYGTRRFIRYLELNDNLLNAFIMGLKQANNVLKLIPASILRVLEEVPKLKLNIKEKLNKYIVRAQVRDKKLSNMRITLLMYYLLFVVDNRAASAREGLNNYWLLIYKNVLKELRESPRYEELLMRLSRRSKGNTLYVSLSLIPP